MEDIFGKNAELSIEKTDALYTVAHALASPVRIQILQALGRRSMSVGELAEALDVPMSTTALGVKILEEAGLISSESQPGLRGAIKLCSRKVDFLSVNLVPKEEEHGSSLALNMPIGGFCVADGIKPTCGLASEKGYIGDMDDPRSFYLTDRFGAQLLWFRQGMLEYRFSFPGTEDMIVDWLELSFEACSEAPMYRDPWKSDISVSINGKRLGVWTSPCDCGGRRGRLSPEWWSELSTQYGFLKIWRVDAEGSYLDNQRISDTTLMDLEIGRQPYLSVCIEVPEDAENVGGLNLFGERFGDYGQPLVMRVGYHLDPEGEHSK